MGIVLRAFIGQYIEVHEIKIVLSIHYFSPLPYWRIPKHTTQKKKKFQKKKKTLPSKSATRPRSTAMNTLSFVLLLASRHWSPCFCILVLGHRDRSERASEREILTCSRKRKKNLRRGSTMAEEHMFQSFEGHRLCTNKCYI